LGKGGGDGESKEGIWDFIAYRLNDDKNKEESVLSLD
jgi:hypothetical protein